MLGAAALACWVLLLPRIGLPQAPPANIYYVYDDLSRLIAVVDQQGNAATYTYDAVGNILAIERFDTAGIPGPVGISLFSPSKGRVGTTVQIFGKGLAASGGSTTVSFNGTAATVTSAAPNRIATSVPAGATSGPITVTSPLGSATSARAFTVLRPIVVSPASASVGVGATRQFEATEEGGGAPPAVRWSVNGTPGGDATVGTISTTGLYTAPTTVPTPGTVTVTATHAEDSTLTASATVTIIPPIPVFLTARGVSVGFPEPPIVVDRSVTAALSVAVEAPPGTGTTTVVGRGVSVAVVASDGPGFAAASGVGVALEPVVTAVSPASAPAGTTVTLTVIGAGLGGATALGFLQNNVADGDFAVADLAVNAEGTQLTAQVTIGAGAVAGARVVHVTTAAGASTRTGTGGNVFTVP